MKFLVSQLTHFLGDRQRRKNLGDLRKYLLFLLVVIAVYSVLFHVIMARVEGERHSWLTGVYWTLTVMSTTGFGDITFHSDIGRVFSIVVLLSGIVLLLIMLPFAFIQLFYAPWLESRIRLQAPRGVDDGVSGHVIICRYDSIAPGLIQKLEHNGIPYFVVEPDPIVAARMMADDIRVVTGEVDSQGTYERLRVRDARMVFANAEDTINTNITLTVREADAHVQVIALAEDVDSIDILELSGATHVLQLKQRLGEHLAARISEGSGWAHVIGQVGDLQIAEFVVHETDLVGKTLAESRLHERTGVQVVAMWNRGVLEPLTDDLRFPNFAVPLAIGTAAQIDRLNALLGTAGQQARPVLIIGAGKVGTATAAAMELRGIPVHVVDSNPLLARNLEDVVHQFVVGDAADREVLLEAGLMEAGAVALTTNDDAVNIYLAIYCRRLKPDLNIVSRITHQRNTEAIYRAGANSVLSYSSLGREYVVSRVLGRTPIMVGEGADFFFVKIPRSLGGRTLARGRVSARTGLIVAAVENENGLLGSPSHDTPLPAQGRLLMIGTSAQRRKFTEQFER